MTFNPLDYPLAWIDPLMLSANTDFVGHVPFAMTLIDLMRPATLVELGVHTGNSYCAFCQAVQLRQLPTRCFGVDTWKGDASMGAYDGNVIFDGLRRYHDPNYGAFSTLMRTEFDSALPQFADGSVDLLHIDGCHAYEAVRHDFEAWLPKMSVGGVVLLHDTTERREGFGVWKLWEEIRGRYPNVNFPHCHGLGMAVVGRQPAAALQHFVQLWRDASALISRFFSFQGRRVESFQSVRFMTQSAWYTQNILNQWCVSSGKPINRNVGTLQSALAQPAAFAYNLHMHAQQVLGGK